MNEEEQPALVYEEKPITWLVWRFNQQAFFCPTNAQQLWMLKAIQEDKSFSEICEGLCQWLEEDKVAQFAAENLRNWIVEGIFSEFKVN